MFFVLFLLILILQPFGKTIYAVSEFSLQKQINYQIDKQGNAKVTQNIKLKNNFSNIYAKQYSLKIENQQIENINASDQTGNIINSIDKDGNQTVVNLSFNQPSTNLTKTTDFILSYDIKNLVTKQGSIWKLDLPQHKATADEDIDISLKVPLLMGQIAYSSIPIQPYTEQNFQVIPIAKNLSQKNISIAFGQMQLFNLNLKYYLKNDQNTKKTFYIPIPPDTSSQTLIIENINPLPQNIIIDTDGNFLAQYNLESKQEINITLKTQAQIHPINPNFPQPTPQPYDTNNTQFWPSTNQTINSISKNLNTSKEIYDYVVNKLEYNFKLVKQAKRKSPLESLSNPQNSICTDFTDLFITLARANSIPSREIQGVVYTTNQKLQSLNISGDLLHSWAQFWNQTTNSWQSIDPTWQKTTNGTDYYNSIDLNHISFVIHGQDDQKPLAPGFYKQNPKQVSIQFNITNTPLKINTIPPLISFDNSQLNIANPNPNSLTNLNISAPNINYSKKINILPPYSTTLFDIKEIKGFTSALPKNKKISFDTFSDQSQLDSIQITNPLFKKYFLLSISGLVLILSLGGIIILKFL